MRVDWLSTVVALTVSWAAGASAAVPDCRDCHGELAGRAAELAAYYGEPGRHHPVGVAFPDNPEAASLNAPDGTGDGFAYFDRNGNGEPDGDEVRLYGPGRSVECASCHREHDGAVSPGFVPAWLRIDNTADALCLTCHRR